LTLRRSARSIDRVPRTPIFLLLVMVLALAAGCAATKEGAAGGKPGGLVSRDLVRPLDGTTAKLLLVNARLRFVVLDYSLSPMPGFGQRLEVVRDGRKVAELKVTGPARGSTTAADIVSGEPRPGDVARVE